MKLRFVDVGAQKRTWEADVIPSAEGVWRHVVKQKVLHSRGIDVEFNAETGEGAIFVGGFRQVGRIEKAAA